MEGEIAGGTYCGVVGRRGVFVGVHCGESAHLNVQ